MGEKLLLFGPPGVGKGTQAIRLSAALRVPHISTGDILRASLQSHTPLGNSARSYVETGKLVPDDIIVEVVRDRLSRRDAREGAGLFCNRRIELPAGPGPHHALDILQQFLRADGVTPRLDFPLVLKAGATYPWQDFFAGDPRSSFVIFTDSRGAEKQWPGFSELTALIFAAIPDSRVAWCAGQRGMPAVPVPAGRFLNLTGCPMDQMIALVRQPAVFIGNDSGPMHLSAAAGNRVLALFGPTSPRRFGPYPLDALAHRAVEAPGGQMDRLATAEVLAALLELRSRAH